MLQTIVCPILTLILTCTSRVFAVDIFSSPSLALHLPSPTTSSPRPSTHPKLQKRIPVYGGVITAHQPSTPPLRALTDAFYFTYYIRQPSQSSHPRR